MAKTEHFRDCDTLSLPVPEGTKAGSPVKVGGITGVTETDRANGSGNPVLGSYAFGGGNADGYATVRTQGAHRLSVTGAVAAVGDPVYITSGNALNVTATGNTLFGYALATKGAAAGVIVVALASQV